MNSQPDAKWASNAAHQPATAMPSSTFLNTLYLTHAEALRRYACARGASREDAEEVVQEMFMRLSAQERLASVQNIFAYMRTIIMNLLNDQYRQQARRPDLLDIDDIDEPESTPGANPALHLVQSEAVRLMQEDLQSLPAQARQVFLQHRLYGRSYDSIASELDLTVAAVRKHLRDSLVLLTQKRIERDN